jgi:4-diphosphocytidyl-2-C-methyl-D-erythritol kinase
MINFPNCKINLGLNITAKREDGYHEIETVFYPVALKDALEAMRVTNNKEPVLFTSSGLPISGDPADNLCAKAYGLLKKDFPSLPALHIHLHKEIPMGAGLGGGSADGAFALLLIDKLCGLDLSKQQLLDYALQLGSDCPFFIFNQPCFATGRGEQLTPVELDLSQYQFVLVNPNIHISTAFAFSQIQPMKPQRSVIDLIKLPVTEWKELLVNDFEKNIAAAHPEIASVKKEMYENGAVYASMTGSGSTVYGLFPKEKKPSFSFQSTYKTYYI